MAGLFYHSVVWHEVLMYLKLLRSYHAFLLVYLHVHTYTQTLLFIRMKSLYIHQRHDRIELGHTSFFGWSHHKTSKWFGWPYGFQSPGLVFIAFA